MPYKAKHPCAYPLCPELTNGKYCPKHQALMNTQRDKSERKHYGRQWEKIRMLFLAKNPLCVHCQQAGRLSPATEVHHIIPVSQGGTDAEENLMALCKSCHSRITLKDNHMK